MSLGASRQRVELFKIYLNMFGADGLLIVHTSHRAEHSYVDGGALERDLSFRVLDYIKCVH